MMLSLYRLDTFFIISPAYGCKRLS